MILATAEGVGVARALAAKGGYELDVNREFRALGGSNALAGLSSGFVQSGGASQTAAAETAGGKTQVASVIAAFLILLTGAVLAPLFEDLPKPMLAAIVIVAVAGFYRVDELQRFAHIRSSALLLALVALAGVLILGVLPGLLVAAGLSLTLLIYRLSRPPVGVLARHPASGVWGRSDRHPAWSRPHGLVVARVDGPLFYANANHVKDHLLALVRETEARPDAVVLELDQSDIDVESLDMLAELAEALSAESVELRLATVRKPVAELLRRAGGDANLQQVYRTVDAAVEASRGDARDSDA